MAEDAAIKEMVLVLLTEKHLRLTPIELERAVGSTFTTVRRQDIRNVIRELVSQGSLVYTQHHSTTHLELNFNRAVRISDRIALSPSHQSASADPNLLTIRLQDGTAFGGGDHPTTRMMLRGMDRLLPAGPAAAPKSALDIGTGTGILAIAAASLGITMVDAVDIDPAACFEARQNIALNGFDHCVKISQRPLNEFHGMKYDLILANLRPPTIVQLIPMMAALSSSSSIWIISGCRKDEGERLKRNLPKSASSIVWEADLAGWSAFGVRASSGKN